MNKELILGLVILLGSIVLFPWIYKLLVGIISLLAKLGGLVITVLLLGLAVWIAYPMLNEIFQYLKH